MYKPLYMVPSHHTGVAVRVQTPVYCARWPHRRVAGLGRTASTMASVAWSGCSPTTSLRHVHCELVTNDYIGLQDVGFESVSLTIYIDSTPQS